MNARFISIKIWAFGAVFNLKKEKHAVPCLFLFTIKPQHNNTRSSLPMAKAPKKEENKVSWRTLFLLSLCFWGGVRGSWLHFTLHFVPL